MQIDNQIFVSKIKELHSQYGDGSKIAISDLSGVYEIVLNKKKNYHPGKEAVTVIIDDELLNDTSHFKYCRIK